MGEGRRLAPQLLPSVPLYSDTLMDSLVALSFTDHTSAGGSPAANAFYGCVFYRFSVFSSEDKLSAVISHCISMCPISASLAFSFAAIHLLQVQKPGFQMRWEQL